METVCRENGLLSRSVVIGGLQCSLTWLQVGLFSRALVLILHFQSPQGSDRDNKTKKEISSLRGEKSHCVEQNCVFCLPFGPDHRGVWFLLSLASVTDAH